MDNQHEPDRTYDLSLLQSSERKWKKSMGLRVVYGDLFDMVQSRLIPGPTLELGSGIGISKEFLPDVVTSDLVKTPYVDKACSAYEINSVSESDWSNIIALDVLHHLRMPLDFLDSAASSLSPGGRIILMEPAATLFGWLFYTLFHHEPIHPRDVKPPFIFPKNEGDDSFSNMGMGYALFHSNPDKIEPALAAMNLTIEEVYFRDVIAYPLTGGYSSPQFLPTGLLKVFLRLEKLLPQSVLRLLGLRMMIVLQKSS